MCFERDPDKAAANRKKHGISFEMAQLVFSVPLILAVPDYGHPNDEECWITVGQAGIGQLILVVVHTYRDTHDEEIIRPISAHKATPKERKQYLNLPGGTQ